MVSMTFAGIIEKIPAAFSAAEIQHRIRAYDVLTVQLYPCSLMTIGKYISIDFRTK